jgi:hypothetical protein
VLFRSEDDLEDLGVDRKMILKWIIKVIGLELD